MAVHCACDTAACKERFTADYNLRCITLASLKLLLPLCVHDRACPQNALTCTATLSNSQHAFDFNTYSLTHSTSCKQVGKNNRQHATPGLTRAQSHPPPAHTHTRQPADKHSTNGVVSSHATIPQQRSSHQLQHSFSCGCPAGMGSFPAASGSFHLAAGSCR